jgi:FKBP-type peptidyl-prolyl cis-trans isomerase FkpA
MTNRRKKTIQTSLDYQRLEQRQMLAGNVAVSLQGDILTITGDGSSNEIRVTGTSTGRARVVPVTGTTVNGSSAVFEMGTTVRNVAIQMAGGNDSVTVENLPTPGYLDLDLGIGNDSANIRDINVRTLNVNGRAGNDVVQFGNTFSPGYITIQTHEGDDTLSITSMASNRGVFLDTGEGSDLIAIDNLGMRENFVVNTAGGNDRVFLTGQVYSYSAQFSLGVGNDTLSVTPQISSTTANFGKQLTVRAGDGNDTVFFGRSTIARKSISIDGGSGSDAVGAPGADLRRASYTNFENRSLANVNAAIETFYDSLQSQGIDTGPYGRVFVPGATLVMSTTPLKHYGFSTAGAVDDALILTGQPGTTVTQVTVSITNGFNAAEDILAFANTGSISGSFNATTGVLTLTGTGSVADFQAALRSVTYDNSNTTTQEETRRIQVVVSTNRGSFTKTRDIDLGDQLTIEAYARDNGLTTQRTSTGLHYIIDTVGNGTFPTISNTVRVNYVGKLLNGTQFDANNNITFPLTGVIVGWQQGIPLFSVGGSGRLIIPSSLAYGPSGQGSNIPPNAVLDFDIDLLGIV